MRRVRPFALAALLADGYALAVDEAGAITVPAVDKRAECLECHLPAQATDWIYARI